MYRHVSFLHLLLLFEGIALIAGFAVTTALWVFEKYVMPGTFRMLR